jgi:hypothetical protein
VNNKLEMARKKTVVAQFEVLSHLLVGTTEEYYRRKPQYGHQDKSVGPPRYKIEMLSIHLQHVTIKCTIYLILNCIYHLVAYS